MTSGRHALARYTSLQRRPVFVTGGASGIGAALVERFHDQGARVAFIDIDVRAGEALAQRLPGVRFRRCDVTDSAALQDAVREAAAALGGLSVLINNVGNDQREAAEEVTPVSWRSTMAVNLDAAMLASVAAYPLIKAAGGGAIVNLSSINALMGPAHLASYSAAKGAINALSKSLARAWGGDSIRVNAVSPGWIVTDRQLALWLTPAAEAAWMQEVALKRRLTPDDVANLVLFLAADDSSAITGQNLVVDGGRT